MRNLLLFIVALASTSSALFAAPAAPATAESSAVGNLKAHQGFKLELLYAVPRDKEGSWVSLCVDPKGRLLVGDQNGKLYRLNPPPVGQSGEIKPEVIDLDIGGAHGLLYAFDSLYVVVNEGSRPHGLYRLRDTNGDDRFDEVKLLRKLEAGGEHGAHSLVVSPDGNSLYIVVGNSSTLTQINSSRVPLLWSEDNLVPRVPTGFMDDSLAPQGWIAKTDPDGQNWELIASGFRNQFDLAFNRLGELFTYDADMEWDIGAPWYRPTRINHVISGAEFGFRNGSGKWPEYFIDSFGSGEQHADFGRKPDYAMGAHIIERLDADRPPCGEELPAGRVENHQGKHAFQPFKHLRSPHPVGYQQRLRIGSAAPLYPTLPQLLAQTAVVVNLTVENDHVARLEVVHRLRSRG